MFMKPSNTKEREILFQNYQCAAMVAARISREGNATARTIAYENEKAARRAYLACANSTR